MTSSDIGWSTPTNNAGEHTGFNDAGIEHFKNDPLAAAAHELPQNAHDAATKGNPVHIEVKKLRVPVKDIPGHEQFREIMAKCAAGPDSKDKKVSAFFTKALAQLDSEEIDVLAVTDANTTGLVGPCQIGTPFYALMKSRGSNVKSSDQALGSFGIGKMAPYANSGFRAIFVSTAYKDGDVTRRLVQGKTILTSHYDVDGTVKDANSYWGIKEGFLPADPEFHADAIPSWLTAPHADGQIGTTIFILDFNGSDTWEQEFVTHYLATFFAAVHAGTATALIGDTTINHDTIGELLNDESLAAAIASNETAKKSLERAQASYLALTGENSEPIKLHFDIFGPATLSVAAGEGLPSKVSVVRNGMLITDEMDDLKRFPAMADFAAVLEFESKETNQILRQMEPPRHDCFEIKRLEDEATRQRAKAGLKEVGKKVRAELLARLRGEVKERVNLHELSNILGEPEDATKHADAAESNPLGQLQITETARKLSSKSRRKATPMQVSKGSGQEGVGTDGHKAKEAVQSRNSVTSISSVTDGPSSTRVSPDEGKDAVVHTVEAGPAMAECTINTFRGIREKPGKYVISFIAPESTTFGLKFEPVGFAKSDGHLKVKSVDGGALDAKGFVRVEAAINQKVRMSVEFENTSFAGPVKVVSYAV
jgi:hypothetical protein